MQVTNVASPRLFSKQLAGRIIGRLTLLALAMIAPSILLRLSGFAWAAVTLVVFVEVWVTVILAAVLLMPGESRLEDEAAAEH